MDDAPRIGALSQGIARRLVPVRWPRSQKLIGYVDLESGELLYMDARGRVLDRVDLRNSIIDTRLTPGVQ